MHTHQNVTDKARTDASSTSDDGDSSTIGYFYKICVEIGFKNDNQSSCRNLQNDSAEQEQPLRDCPLQRLNKPNSYHNLFIVSWITRHEVSKVKLRKATEVNTEEQISKGHNTQSQAKPIYHSPTHTSLQYVKACT
ncbi:hypothetical protein T03_10803 [Trichinella britovi]|uniref:Uncharacterized protein n=1 Tax=Trichinella britovi TaxID=45882 RepID=A0A0V1CB35_TRIBR|nr:hypothetical protein T03_10803 [Trichinella britovi]